MRIILILTIILNCCEDDKISFFYVTQQMWQLISIKCVIKVIVGQEI
jgi:hypothetical protein